MKRQQWVSGFVFFLCLITKFSFAFDEPVKSKKTEHLHPQNSVIYFQYDGSANSQKAFEQTAVYESFFKSGLVDVFKKIANAMIAEGQQRSEQSGGEKAAQQFAVSAEDAKALIGTVVQQGVSLSVSLPPGQKGPPLPTVTLVVNDIGKYEPQIKKGLEAISEQEGIKIKTKTMNEREVSRFIIPGAMGVEVNWWVEGNHLVIVAGIGALENSLNVAVGDAPNVTSNPLYKKYVLKEVDFTRDSIGWFNFTALREKFGEMPIPQQNQESEPRKVNDVLETLGLLNLGAIVNQSGYKGKAIWTEVLIEAPGERTGLLGIADVKPFKLDDLPPLPIKTQGFSAGSIDYAKFYHGGTKIAIDLARFAPPREANKIRESINALPDILGFDLQEELFDNLGKITCVYSDPVQGPYGMGFGIAIQVKNPKELRAGLNNILTQLKKRDRDNLMKVTRSTKQGREILHVHATDISIGPAICVDDNWLVIGIVPQTIESFLLRLDGKLKRWQPSKKQLKGLDQFPKEFTSITMTDPRQMYEMIFGIAPFYMGLAEMGLRQELRYKGEIPFKVSDLPPSEVITNPLFPNYTIATTDEAGFHWTSRSSAPSMELGSVAFGAIAVSVALPAVQQARTAARRASRRGSPKEFPKEEFEEKRSRPVPDIE